MIRSVPTMTDKNVQADAFDLLSQFIFLRQHGVNRDEAWFTVQDKNKPILEVINKAFVNLAKNWERNEGYKYYYRDEVAGPDDTMTRKQLEAQQTAEQRQALEHAKVRYEPQTQSMMTGNLDPSRLREHQQKGLGQVLDQLDRIPDTPPAPVQNKANPESTARLQETVNPEFFGPNTVLLMYFINHPQPLVVQINDEEELFIGRATANAALNPEIDLEQVGGGEFGVSRMHAAITRQDNKLLVVDLGSTNYTRLNGVRLHPDEIRAVRDDDELWFGQLRCIVRFRHR